MKRIVETTKRYIYLAFIHIFNILPVKNNKIFFFSYYGSQYGCSPKYITEYILENCPPGEFDLVWAFNDPDSKDKIVGVRKVKNMSLQYFYELCTSKVIITNFRTTDFFIKRKNQYYIQTWHSSLRLKQIEKDAEDSLPATYIDMAKKDSKKCDLLLSGCEFSTNIFKRAFWYDREIFEHGTPRNDILFQNNQYRKAEVLNKLNLTSEIKIILYAPTFRKGNNLEHYNLDYKRILDHLKKKFGGEWIVLVKLHPHLVSKSDQLVSGESVVDVTSYDDIQELLLIADVLISDYSSLIFDYSITGRPCFLYVPDLKEYVRQDRGLYFNLMRLPFFCAKSNAELLAKIISFQHDKYNQSLKEFQHRIGTYEVGRSSECLVRRIKDVCFDKRKDDEYEAV